MAYLIHLLEAILAVNLLVLVHEAGHLLMYQGTKLYDEGKDAGSYANMAWLQPSTAASNMCDAVARGAAWMRLFR